MAKLPPAQHCLTIKANPRGLLRVLKNQVNIAGVLSAATVGTPIGGLQFPFVALWDTGAEGSVISPTVVQALGLAPTGVTNIVGVNSTTACFTYLVSITLPNGLQVQDVRVAESQLKGCDLLIGMDIITLGDFTITNRGGHTWFSFRVPSQLSTDYVAEHNAAMLRAGATANMGRSKPNRPKPGKSFGKNKKRR